MRLRTCQAGRAQSQSVFGNRIGGGETGAAVLPVPLPYSHLPPPEQILVTRDARTRGHCQRSRSYRAGDGDRPKNRKINVLKRVTVVL